MASRNAGRLAAGFSSANANRTSSRLGFIGGLWILCARDIYAVLDFGGLLKIGELLFPPGGLGGFGPRDVDGTARKRTDKSSGVGCIHVKVLTLSPIRGRSRTLE